MLKRFVLLCGLLAAGATGAADKKAGDVEVDGYTRRDGTYVEPHHRSNPNDTKGDNWSTRGNENPYTGEHGTKKDDGGTLKKK